MKANIETQNSLHTKTLASIALILLLTFFLSTASADVTQNNSSAGPYAYITNSGNGTVSVIDTVTKDTTAMVNVGNNPRGVAITPDGTKAYVTNYGGNSVSVIDKATNTVTSVIDVGKAPYGIAFTPNGTMVYVANTASNNISVIDRATNTIMATVNVGKPVSFG